MPDTNRPPDHALPPDAEGMYPMVGPKPGFLAHTLPIDALLPVYFAIDGFAQLTETLNHDLENAANAAGDLAPLFDTSV